MLGRVEVELALGGLLVIVRCVDGIMARAKMGKKKKCQYMVEKI